MTDYSLTTALDRWIAAHMESVHTCIPAIVESYEGHETRKATITPHINFWSVGGMQAEFPPIAGVPVMFPSSKTFNFVFELSPGDTGLLFFTECALGNWLDGNGAEPVAPEDTTRFSLADAVFIPGLWPFGAVPVTDAPAKGAQISYKGAKVSFNEDETLSIADGKGNTIATSASSITINGNFEVLQ